MKKLILLLALALVMCGCKKEPIDNYKGGIVKSKQCNVDLYYHEIIQIKDTLKDIFVLKSVYVCSSDYDRYEIGDTIK